MPAQTAPQPSPIARVRSAPPWVKALLVSLGLCLLWCARPPTIMGHPFGDLSNGSYTDHFSHMNSARLFARVGTALWRQPVQHMLPVREDLRRQFGVPARVVQVFEVPGWPADKPLAMSWAQNPRMYPPGDLLIVAPIALLYHHTGLGFRLANRLLIACFVVLAHLAFVLLFRSLLARPADRRITWPMAIAVFVFCLYWTLQGFYDLIAAIPLIYCAILLERRRGLEAVFWFCVAAFIHFRVMFFAPWVLYGAWLALQDARRQGLAPRQWLMLVGTAALSAATLIPFWWLQPALATLELNSPIHPRGPNFNLLVAAVYAAISAVAGLLLYRARAWLDLAVLAFLTVMMFALHQAYEWHPLILFAWLGAPVARRSLKWARSVVVARFGVLAAATALVFCFHRY